MDGEPKLSKLQESGDYYTTIRFHENLRPGPFRWLEILEQFRQETLRILLAQNMLCSVGSVSNGTRIRHKDHQVIFGAVSAFREAYFCHAFMAVG
jgi:hypothetical protein